MGVIGHAVGEWAGHLVADGLPVAHVAAAAGVARPTLYRWIEEHSTRA